MPLQKLLQHFIYKDVNNIYFQKSPNIWIAADLHFHVISSPLSFSFPHVWSQEFILYFPEMLCIAAGKVHLLKYAKCIPSYTTVDGTCIY